MRLFEIMEFIKVYDICKDSFTVNVVDSDYSFICIKYKNEWLIVEKKTERVYFHCVSRCDCLECLNYHYGLPF